jgi:ABC-type transport system involved in multi-copper enzyme maturation permease subunit
MATSISSSAESAPASAGPHWLDRLDAWCERFGDSINPILVKETRQALKSRQFVVTFSLILLAALGWTIAGSLSLMPQIYTTPSAPRMMIGYYVVLALPMLLVVPLAAYRSLESEIDDGTLELLSITALSPWQIVIGKLASASLQMLLYFVTLFPCLAYAYTLRGVDLPTTLLSVGALMLVGGLLTIAGLFFAPLARGRTTRVTTLLALIFLLVLSEYLLGALVVSMILYGNPLGTTELLCVVIASSAVVIATGHLLLTATAAQLTPETENRSTGLRLSLIQFTAVVIFVTGLCLLVFEGSEEGLVVYVASLIVLAIVWTMGGSMMVAERSTITPRIRRELPSSFLARLFLTWLTPGPDTGLVFTILSVSILAFAQQFSLDWILRSGMATGGNRVFLQGYFGEAGLLFPCYLLSYLVVVRFLMWGVRLKNDPRVEVGLAALVVVSLLASLGPYSLQLHYNDYQPLPYDPVWQISNWIFTIASSMDNQLPAGQVQRVLAITITLCLMALFSAWKTTRPRRIATPSRVAEELAAIKTKS